MAFSNFDKDCLSCKYLLYIFSYTIHVHPFWGHVACKALKGDFIFSFKYSVQQSGQNWCPQFKLKNVSFFSSKQTKQLSPFDSIPSFSNFAFVPSDNSIPALFLLSSESYQLSKLLVFHSKKIIANIASSLSKKSFSIASLIAFSLSLIISASSKKSISSECTILFPKSFSS